MRSILRLLSCFALFATPLSFDLSVYAQQPDSSAPQMENAGLGVWNGACPERQELREERERIRAEHEQLESEHDTLKVQCMNTKGQDRSECRDKFDALRVQTAALHERMKVLHDKVESEPACHHKGEHKGEHSQWPARAGQQAAPVSSGGIAPAGQ